MPMNSDSVGEGPLSKVRKSLAKTGLSDEEIDDVVDEMQSDGVMFVELQTETDRNVVNVFDERRAMYSTELCQPINGRYLDKEL